jgi:hypothetical protein
LQVFAADSFKGIPPVKPGRYRADAVHAGAEMLSAHEHNSPALLKHQFELSGLWDPARVAVLEGYFNESLPRASAAAAFTQFAVLRLDGDTYESTFEALEVLYPFLTVGGFVIVDDYLDWSGARQAATDYRRRHGIGRNGTAENLVAVYHSHGEIPRGVWWQKMAHHHNSSAPPHASVAATVPVRPDSRPPPVA